ATGPRGSGARDPKSGPVALISKAAARGASTAASSTTKRPPLACTTATSPGSTQSRSASRAASAALKTLAWSAESRKRAARRSRGARPPRRMRRPCRALSPSRPQRCGPERARRLAGRERRRTGGVVDVADEDREAVAAQVARAQLVRVARRLEHAHPGEREAPRRLGREARHREPLRGHGLAVLAAGVADVARRHAGRARELARDVLGRAPGLLDAHEGVLAPARRRVGRELVDGELLGPRADPHRARVETGAKERRWIGEGPSRRSAARCADVA